MPVEVIEKSKGRRVRETEKPKGEKTLKYFMLADVSVIFNKEKNNLVKAPGFGRKQFNTV